MAYKEVCYDMNHKKRGHCLILNNMRFDEHTGLGERNGSQRDTNELQILFRKFGFMVSVYIDMTVRELKDLLRKYGQDIDHSDCDALVVIFMSHGEEDIFFGRDGAFKSDLLFDGFRASECCSLAGKPKLFFIEANRGENIQEAVALPKLSNRMMVPAHPGIPARVQQLVKIDIKDEVPSEVTDNADFLKCWSTPNGCYSWRNTINGSWFVQSIINVFSQATGKEDILQLLTMVNFYLNTNFESNTPAQPKLHGKKQSSFFESTLTAKLYLAPSTS
ncbi:caspase-7-like [Penaeus japonicus]|uniref:caspase-7-like n=1 Tax=Penaeus japonicus TaxID=27405 RepID=UPI001C717143|nr:caspase-7-like [Penaeus japonicus]